MNTITHRCGLMRRFAAILYDTLLLLAVLIFAILPVVFLLEQIWAINTSEHAVTNWLLRLYLLGVGFAYFSVFWVRAGQTLGMRAWRVLLVDASGKRPGIMSSLVRYLASILSWLPLGAGFFWGLFDPDRQTLHDRLSRTQLVVLPRE